MQYPVTATQWHPEKNVFEWATHLHVPHSFEAVSPACDMRNACCLHVLGSGFMFWGYMGMCWGLHQWGISSCTHLCLFAKGVLMGNFRSVACWFNLLPVWQDQFTPCSVQALSCNDRQTCLRRLWTNQLLQTLLSNAASVCIRHYSIVMLLQSTYSALLLVA